MNKNFVNQTAKAYDLPEGIVEEVLKDYIKQKKKMPSTKVDYYQVIQEWLEYKTFLTEDEKRDVDKWRKEHKKVFVLVVEDKKAFVRIPNRKEIGYANQISDGGLNFVAYGEAILNSIWLGGDEEIKTEDDYFLAICQDLITIVDVRMGEIKKL